MLTPKQLLEIADSMQPHLDELNTWITKDIIRRVMARLSRTNELKLSATDIWQAQVLRDAGGHTEELQKQLSRFTQNSEDEIRAIFEDAGLLSYAADAQVFQAAGIRATPLRQSPRMIEILTDSYCRTNAEIRNFTRTTAIQSTRELIKVLDAAHFKTMSGAQSYSAAVAEAVEELANYQARVSYPTGHTDTLETAVFRAVRTGVAQACGNMSVAAMEAHEWDIVLVSAHLGARYGDGGENPGNHFWWQGRFYSLNGKTPGLPPFRESTGYGTGEGLCGWNCRHSFGPGDGKHNPYQQFDAEENKAAYDLSQKQRSMEAAIRRNKHRLIAYQEAAKGAENDADKAKARQCYDATLAALKRQNAAYDQFCASNNLKRQAERLQTAKFRQSMAEKKQVFPDPAANNTVQAAGQPNANTAVLVAGRPVNTQMRAQKQQEHIIGSKAFDRRTEAAITKGSGFPSGFMAGTDVQALVMAHMGKGTPDIGKSGAISEYFDAASVIGWTYVRDAGAYVQTRRVCIRYSKTGWHAFPVEEVSS